MRDERRDSEITDLKKKVAILERDTERLNSLVTGMHYAMFGIPEDRTNNGLVGTMADIKESQKKIQTTLISLLVTVLSGVGIDIITRATG